LKRAGLADELKENDLMGLTSPLALFPKNDSNSSKGIVEPATDSVQKQTVPATVFPKVNGEPSEGPDMAGCIGSTGNIETKDKTEVDMPAKDPTPTDHITGGMGSTPVNPKILSKCGGQLGGGSEEMSLMSQTIMPRDISIDIAESKKILRKMIQETTIGPKNAFGIAKKEGYGGNPDTDPAYIKGKRWTVDYNRSPKYKGNNKEGFDSDGYHSMGDYNDEMVKQAVQTVVDQSTGDYESDIGAIITYLQDQGSPVNNEAIESMYKLAVSKKTEFRDNDNDDGYGARLPAPDPYGERPLS
jgi:hypothetical protein